MENMVKVVDLKNGLEPGEYGEYLNDYRDSSTYICDAISEIADSNTSIYWSDIEKFISENVEEVSDTINEYGWDGCGNDLYKAGQAAEFRAIERDIYDNLPDALMLAALDYVRYSLEMEEIPEELADAIRDWADEAGSGDRMDDIPDKIREWLECEIYE